MARQNNILAGFSKRDAGAVVYISVSGGTAFSLCGVQGSRTIINPGRLELDDRMSTRLAASNRAVTDRSLQDRRWCVISPRAIQKMDPQGPYLFPPIMGSVRGPLEPRVRPGIADRARGGEGGRCGRAGRSATLTPRELAIAAAAQFPPLTGTKTQVFGVKRQDLTDLRRVLGRPANLIPPKVY